MDSLDFETAFAELEATVQRLEAGNLPLAEALALYERGIQLARLCGEHLDQAELRVQQVGLVAEGDESGDDEAADWDAEEEAY